MREALSFQAATIMAVASLASGAHAEGTPKPAASQRAPQGAAPKAETPKAPKNFDLVAGSGAEAKAGTFVVVRYLRWFGSFGENYDGKLPAVEQASIASGDAGPAGKTGNTVLERTLGMKAGGRRSVWLPAGSSGSPRESLFLLELLGVFGSATAANQFAVQALGATQMQTLDGRTVITFPSTSPAAEAVNARKAKVDNKIFGIGVGERFPALPLCKDVTNPEQPHCLNDEPEPPNYVVLVNGALFETSQLLGGLLAAVNPGTKKVETVTFNCTDAKAFAKTLEQKYGPPSETGRHPIANGDRFHYVPFSRWKFEDFFVHFITESPIPRVGKVCTVIVNTGGAEERFQAANARDRKAAEEAVARARRPKKGM